MFDQIFYHNCIFKISKKNFNTQNKSKNNNGFNAFKQSLKNVCVHFRSHFKRQETTWTLKCRLFTNNIGLIHLNYISVYDFWYILFKSKNMFPFVLLFSKNFNIFQIFRQSLMHYEQLISVCMTSSFSLLPWAFSKLSTMLKDYVYCAIISGLSRHKTITFWMFGGIKWKVQILA